MGREGRCYQVALTSSTAIHVFLIFKFSTRNCPLEKKKVDGLPLSLHQKNGWLHFSRVHFSSFKMEKFYFYISSPNFSAVISEDDGSKTVGP